MVGMGNGVSEPDTIRCSGCGTLIPEDRVREPCPKCGSLQRKFSAHLSDGVVFSDTVKANVFRVFFQQHPGYRWAVRVIGVASLVAGYFVAHVPGLVVGVAALFVSDVLGSKGWGPDRKRIG